MKYTIEHLNKQFTTKHFSLISNEKCEEIRLKFLEKPEWDDVINQMCKLKFGGKKTNIIIDYYIKTVMYKAKLKGCKWSIHEFLQSNDLIRFLKGKVDNNPNFYKHPDEIVNLKTVLRLSPSGTAAKVSNFPYNTMLKILKKFNRNNNYYDYSCGWGIRLLSSLSNNINYFGTDPNFELTKQLNQLSTDFINITGSKSKTDIRTQGSEEFVKEWENKIGLAFSSPPYFDLEDYQIGNQSINNKSYQEWLSDYWENTVINIKKYLISDGYFLLNMKNLKDYSLLTDMQNLIEKHGFIYQESLLLKNINRPILNQNNKNTDEQIVVYKKKSDSVFKLF